MRNIILLVFALNAQAFAQPALQQQAIVLNRMIQKNHYSPRPANDSLSIDIFNLVINDLDKEKVIFTRPEYEQLSTFRLKIDDEITGKSWGCLKLLGEVYRKALQRADSIVTLISKQPINFDKAEFLPIKSSADFPENGAVLQHRWAQYLKSEVLEHIYDLHEKDSTSLSKTTALKDEAKSRASVAGVYHKSFTTLLADPNNITRYLDEVYLKCISSAQDPHTEFFPADEEKEFNASLSSENMRYGFSLKQDDDGNYRFAALAPGSPAWYSGDIHVNDKLVSVKTPSGKLIPAKNAIYASLDSAFDNPSQSVELIVESADGKTAQVKLQKALVSNEDNFVKGYILTLNGKKTGYISLPSFYTSWDENTGSSCANDVAKEIVKLKKEGIEALVLDLRYNGGGSVEEAVELSGIFIDAGPISLIKEGGKTSTLKDPARGTIYDGPLAVMINGQSASASELVAGALQDYNRAVIIGGSSFGKATMQAVLPMDTTLDISSGAIRKQPDEKNGFVKVTLGKIYRITGNTNQLSGVVPDVKLPDFIEAQDYTERTMPFALPSDTVMKKVFYTALKPLPVETLARLSKQRAAGSEYFKRIEKQLLVLKEINAQNNIPLQWDAYQQWREKQKLHETISGSKTGNNLTVSPATFDNKLMELNAFQKEQNSKLIEAIAGDAYIEEAVRVLFDLKAQ